MATSRENLSGAGLMMAALFAYTANDVLIKTVAVDLGLGQSVLVRGIAATLLISVAAAFSGAFRFVLPRRDKRLVALRVGAEVLGTVTFLTALLNIPLASVSAVLQIVPLAVTLAAALLFQEPLGWRRLTAILVAFAAVVVIIRPGGETFSPYSLWALATVACIVVRDLATRRLSPEIPALLVSFWTALAIGITGGLLMIPVGWEPMQLDQVLRLSAAAVAILGGYVLSVMAMRTGEISFIAPFRYSVMIWAVGLGYLVLGEVPDAVTLSGTGVIIAMGLYAFHREQLLARQERRRGS